MQRIDGSRGADAACARRAKLRRGGGVGLVLVDERLQSRIGCAIEPDLVIPRARDDGRGQAGIGTEQHEII